ncbi:Gfo/Idh/MocA family protein [Bacteroidota bacterium]
MFMDKVRWGILGCGDVTEVKSGPAFNKIKNSELVAVMRRNAEKASDYAKRHKVPKWYDNAEELIEDKEVDAIYIATPPDAHAELTIKALNAGKPVYVEKPMARTYAECEEMVTAAERNKQALFVAYYRRSLPGFKKVKQLIDEGEIGKPLTVGIKLFKPPSQDEINNKLPWRVKPEIAGGGHFYDLASHQLDYFDYLFGPVKEVKGIAKNIGGLYEAEDTISASFVFENKVVGTGSWCFVSSVESDCDIMEITGNKGKISFSCFNFTPIVLENEFDKKEYDFEKPEHVQYYLIQEVVDELTGTGKSPSSGLTGMHTNWVMEEIVNDYYKSFKNY